MYEFLFFYKFVALFYIVNGELQNFGNYGADFLLRQNWVILE
jgi:hypothetical protein